jgi:hypothetical protein
LTASIKSLTRLVSIRGDQPQLFWKRPRISRISPRRIEHQESSENLEHPLDSATVSQQDVEIARRDSCDFAALTILLGIKGFTGRHDGSRFD